MPRETNKNIGSGICPSCSKVGDIRREKNHTKGLLYLNCLTCGILFKKNQDFFSTEKCNFIGISGMEDFYPQVSSTCPVPVPTQNEPVPEPVPTQNEPVPVPAPVPVPSTCPSLENKDLGWNEETGLII